MEIIGVDFSGARSDTNTWMTQATLDGQGLAIDRCRPIRRADLTAFLAEASDATVAALDFPFSVPLEFARYWRPEAESMPELWDAAADMTLEEFMALRDVFLARWGEPKRLCDTHYPESFSCLHKTNPNMVPMTFHGMRMLDRLWATGCEVPPLESSTKRVVLLEVMPGAVLRALKLPYKGYKKGARALELRQRIIDGLSQGSPVPLRNIREFRDISMSNDDCLDSLVAAFAAALWIRDPSVFLIPTSKAQKDLDPAVLLLEGWLYAPART